MWLKEEEENPPRPPIRTQSSKAVYARYCIDYCQPAVILRSVLITVLEATTGENCCQQNCTSVCRDLAKKSSLVELKSG